MNDELVNIHRFILDHYNLEEFRTLCFELGIKYDELAGEGISAKARELVLLSGRNHLFEKLLTVLHKEHPETFQQAGLSTNPEFSDHLYEQLPSYGDADTSKIRPGWPLLLFGLIAAGLLVVAIFVIVFANRSSISTADTPPVVFDDSTAVAARQTMEQRVPGVVTVRVEDPRATAITRGFFTERGYIVAFVNSASAEVDVVWTSDSEEKREKARVVQRGTLVPEEIVLLELIEATPPQVQYPIQLSTSLKQGQLVERYVTQQDRAPGEVIEVVSTREVLRSPDLPMAIIDQAFVTTNLAALTDSGAPILDGEGRLVAMIYGGTDTETISVPIGNIKADFDQAFR